MSHDKHCLNHVNEKNLFGKNAGGDQEASAANNESNAIAINAGSHH